MARHYGATVIVNRAYDALKVTDFSTVFGSQFVSRDRSVRRVAMALIAVIAVGVLVLGLGINVNRPSGLALEEFFEALISPAGRLANGLLPGRSVAQEHMKYSVIAVEYVGETDKPITPIVISTSKTGAEWYCTAVLKRSELELTYVHVVSVSLFEKLIADAGLHRGTFQEEQGNNPKSSSKTVSVTIITPQKQDTFLHDTRVAISLLESLQKRCQDDQSLRSDLSHFQDRIRP